MNPYVVLIKTSLFIGLYSLMTSLAYSGLLSIEEYNKRLKTFDQFPENKSISVTRENLARAGLTYIGNSNDSDDTQCLSCKIILWGWDAEDIPIEEHIAGHFKHNNGKIECSFILEYMGSKKNRKNSLTGKSCMSNNFAWSNYTVDDLSDWGYFFVRHHGSKSDEASLVCYCCGNVIFSGSSFSNLQDYHHKQSPNCTLLQSAAKKEEPKHIEWQSAEARLRTMDCDTNYSAWRLEAAKAGFFCDNNKEYMCFQCGKRLECLQGNMILDAHMELNPICPFLIESYSMERIGGCIIETGREGLERTYPEYLDSFDSRVQSFFTENDQGERLLTDYSVSAEKAAKSGFRYTDGKMECVECHCCLSGNEQRYGLWTMHVTKNSDCDYVCKKLSKIEIFYLKKTRLSQQEEEQFFTELKRRGEDWVRSAVTFPDDLPKEVEARVCADQVDSSAAACPSVMVYIRNCRVCSSKDVESVSLGCGPKSKPHTVCTNCVKGISRHYAWQCPFCYCIPEVVRISRWEEVRRKKPAPREGKSSL